MNVKEFADLVKVEIEVIDKDVDIDCPFYYSYNETMYDEEEENERYPYWCKMCKWILSLDVDETYKEGCTISLFDYCEKRWKKIVSYLMKEGYTFGFLEAEDLFDCDEYIADFVNVLFKAIGLGYDGLCKDFYNYIVKEER